MRSLKAAQAAILDAVGDVDNPRWETWVRQLAKSYSDTVVFRVVAEYKDIDRHSVQIAHRDKFFTDLFHRTVHLVGTEWIGGCAESCPKRPENGP